MIDYLIVGLGLAGLSFCEQLEQTGKSYRVIADGRTGASSVAGGLYNPIVLKRFNPVWRAQEQMEGVRPFYARLSTKLGVDYDIQVPVLRLFSNIEEQNSWFQAADRPVLSRFLSTEVVRNSNASINAPFDYGLVKHTGRVETAGLVRDYQALLKVKGKLERQPFQHQNLEHLHNGFTYEGIQARKVVFAEGFGLKNNPYFNYLPLQGTKGELLTIASPDLREDRIVKSAVFIIPLGESLYRVGATYAWDDTTTAVTAAAREELVAKLRQFVKCDFEVIDQVAGIRPTVSDRRPLVGEHPKHKGMYVLNGLGSRGVMIAPYVSKMLYAWIEKGQPLPHEMDISRFKTRYGEH